MFQSQVADNQICQMLQVEPCLLGVFAEAIGQGIAMNIEFIGCLTQVALMFKEGSHCRRIVWVVLEDIVQSIHKGILLGHLAAQSLAP